MPSPLTPNSGREFPKTAVSDGDFILFTPGNPGYVVIEGGGGSGTLPTTDAADGITGAAAPTTAIEIGSIDGSGKLQGVSAANPLPISGSITASNPSIGVDNATAPTSSTQIGSIDGSGKLQGVSAANPLVEGGVYNTSLPTLTTGHASAIQLDSSGRQLVVDAAAETSLASLVTALSNPLPVSCTQTTSPWVISGAVTTSGTATVSGTVAFSNTTIASTAISGAYVAGSLADGAIVTLGAKTDAKATATDSTSITAMQVLKEISYMEQNPASRAVTNAGTFAVQAVGALTNNNAAPAANNIGALTALANAAAPTYTEGDQVLASVDLSGHQRVVATGGAAAGAAAAGNPVLAAGLDYSGNVQSLATDTTGKPRMLGATMNPAIIQGALGAALTNVTIAGTTCVKAYTNPVKLGDTLVVCVALGAAQTCTITDSLNLQWQTAQYTGTTIGAYAFYAVVTTAGTPTVTITTASTDIAMALYEVEGIGSADGSGQSTNGTGTALSTVIPATQERELAFYVVGAGAGTISAASPKSPASSIFDTGNVAVAGTTALKNFGVFSAQLGAPVLWPSGTGNITNTFTATLSSSVVYSAISLSFRPAAVSVSIAGQVVTTNNAAIVLPVATGSTSTITDTVAGSYVYYQSNAFGTNAVPVSAPMLYNGSTWDRQRANYNTTTGDVTPLASGAGTYNGATQVNYNARGAVITMLCGAVSGTSPTVKMQLQWSPDAGTTWLNYGAATSAISVATGSTVTVEVYPTVLTGLTLGATGSALISAPLPRTWRAVYTGGGTLYNIATTGVYVNYIL